MTMTQLPLPMLVDARHLPAILATFEEKIGALMDSFQVEDLPRLHGLPCIALLAWG